MTNTQTNRSELPFRIDRAGSVYVASRVHHGRLSGEQIFVGNIWKDDGAWRNDQATDRYKTQSEAAKALVRIVGPSVRWAWER